MNTDCRGAACSATLTGMQSPEGNPSVGRVTLHCGMPSTDGRCGIMARLPPADREYPMSTALSLLLPRHACARKDA